MPTVTLRIHVNYYLDGRLVLTEHTVQHTSWPQTSVRTETLHRTLRVDLDTQPERELSPAQYPAPFAFSTHRRRQRPARPTFAYQDTDSDEVSEDDSLIEEASRSRSRTPEPQLRGVFAPPAEEPARRHGPRVPPALEVRRTSERLRRETESPPPPPPPLRGATASSAAASGNSGGSSGSTRLRV